MGFRRGDIIWARVKYPQKWWPGVVVRVKGHWVAVSFFNNIKSKNYTYFLETEVCSFKENLESLVKTLKKCSKGEKLLDFALKLIARRVYSSLKSARHLLPPREHVEISRKDLFQCDEVLGFVLDVAVKPFIGVSDWVFAVTMGAKINACRDYLVGSCSVAQKSDASKLEFEPLDDDQHNRRTQTETKETKIQSLNETLVMLRCLALDTKYLSGECLNIVKQNVLMFKNLVHQISLNPILKKCSHSSSDCRNIQSQPCVEVDGNDCRDVITCLKPHVANSIGVLGLKRQFDHRPIDSDFSFKLCKTMPLCSIDEANIDLQKRKMAPYVFVFNSLISKPALSALSLKFCNSMTFAFFNGRETYPQISRTRCEANASSAFSSGSKFEEVMIDDASAGARYYLPSPDTTDQIQMEPSCGDQVTSIKANGEVSMDATIRNKSMDNKKLHPVVTCDASLEPKVKQQLVLDALPDYQYLHMKFPKNFNLPSKEALIRKFSKFGKIDSFRTKIFTRLGSAQVVFLHHLDAVTAYQYAKRKKIVFGESKILFWLDPCEKKRRVSKYVVPFPNLKSCLKKSKKHVQEDKEHTKRVRFLMET